jgi:hypothetical protein
VEVDRPSPLETRFGFGLLHSRTVNLLEDSKVVLEVVGEVPKVGLQSVRPTREQEHCPVHRGESLQEVHQSVAVGAPQRLQLSRG